MKSKKWQDNELLNLILESENNFIWEWDVDSGELYFDEKCLKKLAYNPAEDICTIDWWQNNIHPENRPDFDDTLAPCLGGEKERFKIHYRMKAASGEWIWIQTIGRCVEMNENGTPARFVGVHRDINEFHEIARISPDAGVLDEQQSRQRICALEEENKKLKEEIVACREIRDQLRESEEKIKLLMNSTAEGIFGIDTNGRCTFCNSACVNLLGYESEKDILGQNIHALIHHTRKDGSVCPMAECGIFSIYKMGQSANGEDDIFWRSDRSSFQVAYHSHPVFKADEVIGAVVTFNDVTEKSRTKKLLEKSMRTCADIVSEIPSGLFTYQYVAPDKLILLDGNRESERISGITIMEWKGQEFNDIWPSAKKQGLTDAFLNVVKTGETYRTENKVYKDNRLDGAFKIHAFKLPGEKLAVAFDNITEIRKNEEEREQLIQKLKNALNEIKTLRGILPICSSCKKIRDDKGYWNQIEFYISTRSDAEFSHSICPECAGKIYPDEFNPYKHNK